MLLIWTLILAFLFAEVCLPRLDRHLEVLLVFLQFLAQLRLDGRPDQPGKYRLTRHD